ncbi:ATP-binding protein (plasmid) [Methylomarinum sp. Ch1-1]|uniref:ATP-binding protein n=1 Tax=Methylomarinum roseum TaxID=3067653 RepID=A0AAU7NP51_9GAMM|nr:ATP-binding protein [Methylomarinum sp. Ch1-1]MDP4523129.1 ATP-binding protein [Methylomarinum sp. Ch1-1]
MITRNKQQQLLQALNRQAAVALIGPRQVGKTTLALEIANTRKAVYLDLEAYEDREKLKDPVLFLSKNEGKLVILDEIHRMPELFQTLRGLIDRGRRKGLRSGRFLILGSASIDLLRQSGETLAGRIEYIDMGPLNISETSAEGNDDPEKLWVRGGFPDSYLAANDQDSYAYRRNFIRTYLERDVPQFGPRIPAETLERLWIMLAHSQGQCLNASRLAGSLSISAPTVSSYIDLLVDLLLVRRLPPFHSNVKKRLVKSPRIFVRDSGITHALLGLADYNQLSGHPVFGASWEGFVIENLLSAAPDRTAASFYRTSAGAEIDLVLQLSGGETWTVEIKSGLTAKPEKGFYHALEDIKPDRSFVVYAGKDRYPMTEETDIISLLELVQELKNNVHNQ